MNAPRLNRSLVLEAPMRISDGAGGYTNAWQPLGVLWAQIKAGTGREAGDFAATVSRVPFKIIVRAAPFGTPSRPVAGQRLREGARLYHINAVAEKDVHARYLTCFAEEEVAS